MSDLNSYQSGKIIYPLYDLLDGTHTLSVKVWDVYNNSSDDYTEFVVVSSENLAIQEVLNYPNPFSDITHFQFEHNRPDEPLLVSIEIPVISKITPPTFETRLIFFLKFFENIKNFWITYPDKIKGIAKPKE